MENLNGNQTVAEKRAQEGDGKIYTQEVLKEKRLWMPFGKISWPAIFAGVMVTTVSQILLSLLGIGIGMASVDPLSETNPMAGLGTGTIIWWSVTTLVSLFLGGWTTGKMYPLNSKMEINLHGLLTWCAFTLFSFFMLTTSVGKIVSGAGNAIGTALNASAAMVEGDQIDISSLTRQARTLLPGFNIRNQSEAEVSSATTSQEKMGTRGSQEAGINAQLLIYEMEVFFKGENINNPEIREALIATIVRETGMSDTEANAQVDKWVSSYEQLKAEAKVKADNLTNAVSRASIIGFFALIIGALVTIWGARVAPARE